MFRRQQNSNPQQIKSFSSRVGRRGTKKQEEKEEEKEEYEEEPVQEPVKPTKPQGRRVRRVVKEEDLPVFTEATTIGESKIDHLEMETSGQTTTVVIYLKKLVGDYIFDQQGTAIQLSLSDQEYAEFDNVISGSTKGRFVVSDYVPTITSSNTVSAKLVGDTAPTTVTVKKSSQISTTKSLDLTSNWITIQRLYINNTTTIPEFSGVFKGLTSPTKTTKYGYILDTNIPVITGITSNLNNKADIQNLYLTNCL